MCPHCRCSVSLPRLPGGAGPELRVTTWTEETRLQQLRVRDQPGYAALVTNDSVTLCDQGGNVCCHCQGYVTGLQAIIREYTAAVGPVSTRQSQGPSIQTKLAGPVLAVTPHPCQCHDTRRAAPGA